MTVLTTSSCDGRTRNNHLEMSDHPLAAVGVVAQIPRDVACFSDLSSSIFQRDNARAIVAPIVDLAGVGQQVFNHHGEPIATQGSGFRRAGGTSFHVYQHQADGFHGAEMPSPIMASIGTGDVGIGSLARSDGGSNTRDKAAVAVCHSNSPGVGAQGELQISLRKSGPAGSFGLDPVASRRSAGSGAPRVTRLACKRAGQHELAPPD